VCQGRSALNAEKETTVGVKDWMGCPKPVEAFRTLTLRMLLGMAALLDD